MKVQGSSQSCEQVDVQALAVPVFKDEQVDKGFLKTLDRAVGGLIANVITAEEFAGKEGETAYFQLPGKGLKARRLRSARLPTRFQEESRMRSTFSS